MKKFIVAILAFLYLSTSVGATVHMHYCMGKLVHWSLWPESNPTCNNCGMEMEHGSKKDGCCKDEQKIIKKSDNDQKPTQTAFHLLQLISLPALNTSTELSSASIATIIEIVPISHAPPRCGIATYIRNCTFLI